MAHRQTNATTLKPARYRPTTTFNNPIEPLINPCTTRITMATPLTNYTVEMEQTGLSGWVSYREPLLSLRFAYEHFFSSVYIFVPGDDQWAFYCRGANARQAAERRAEILQRIASEVRNKHAPSAIVQINDFGIELRF